MTQLTQRVYRNFVPLAKSKGVKLQFVDNHVPCHAEVDRDKIVQVVSNIVSNAIKYTEMGGTVKLGISYDSEYTVIFCEDTGIGISKEDLPYIFNRLYRADKSRSRFTGGVGLGLSIAKALIEAHDGSFEVESELGKGSVFQIRIPNEYKAP
jgi:signal transduction histidine kinase